MTKPTERGPGRPRDPARTKAILKAAYRLLLRHGMEGVTTTALAEAAGVSTATLYRWWPSKEAIVMDGYLAAVDGRVHAHHAEAQRHSAGRPVRAIDRLREQLLGSVEAFNGKEGRALRSLLVCVQQSEDLRQVFLDRLIGPRRRLDSELVSAAGREGDLPLDVDPDDFLDALYGPLYFRFFVGHNELTSEFASSHFDQVVRGARAQKGQSRRRSGVRRFKRRS